MICKNRVSHVIHVMRHSIFVWSHQGLNLGPPDYESGATNQLSYRTNISFAFGDFFVGLRILSLSLPKGSSFLRHSPALKSLKIKPKSSG